MSRCIFCESEIPRLKTPPRFCPSCGRGVPETPAKSSFRFESARGEDDLRAVEDLKRGYGMMTEEIGKVIVGQNRVIEELLIAMFCRGHCLLVGVPGLAKTLLVSTVSQILNLTFKRIQFTPDLMPADITGTDIIQDDPETGRRRFTFTRGPIFANIVLADEINRTPPKTQAALLEAMQEHHVTVGENTYPLPEPFFVLATQNPIELEGTYPLPEAQLDRFMFFVRVDYPNRDEELEVMKKTTSHFQAIPGKILTGPEILWLQGLVRKVPVPDHVYQFARDLVRASRPGTEECPKAIKDYISWGAGPRASQYLILGGKARSILHGRTHVTTEDIIEVAPPVLRHRILTTFSAESEGIRSEDIVAKLIEITKRRNVRGAGVA